MKKIEKISKSEFERLNNSDKTYFLNDCLFDESDDNIIAFTIYSTKDDKLIEFYKVLNTN